MEQRAAFEVFRAARCPLELLHQLGDVFDVRRPDGAASVVHQDVDAPVGVHDALHEPIDGGVVTLVTNPLCRSVGAARHIYGRGKAGQSAAGTADDGRPLNEQLPGDPDADAPARAGDDRDLAVQASDASFRWVAVPLERRRHRPLARA